jgi:hypothetical protein
MCTVALTHPIEGFNVSWTDVVKTNLATSSWPNSFDEIHNFFSKVLFESHPNFFYALLVHFGFIKDLFFCSFLDSLVEKVSLLFGDIPSNLHVPHVPNPLKMVFH